MSINEVFWLLVIFQGKHFISDFLLQTTYMMNKTRGGYEWVMPLAVHAAVHGFMTAAICYFIEPRLWVLGLADFAIHFVIDRIKAHPGGLGRYKVHQKQFWEVLGMDQAAHHITNYSIIYVLMLEKGGIGG